jgi:hypothetical protein
MKREKMIFVLTGGLGNQLFQLNYVDYLQRTQQIEVSLDTSLGRPRSKKLFPDSFNFGIPCEVLPNKHSSIASKSIGFMLRMGYAPRSIEKTLIFKVLATIAASIILSFHFRKLLVVATPNDLGFDQNFQPRFKRLITMGYFQSYKYSEKTTEGHSFRKSPESQKISKYRELAQLEQPLIIHVRRGDYGNEDNFGLLGPSYYSEAINKIESIVPNGKIWLFSDEPETALTLFSTEQRSKIRVIEEVDDCPSHTLEVMRFGSSYIIANSTFSWWAARSAYNSSAPVAAPSTWFKGMKSPADLIPISWHVIKPDFL